MIDIEQLLTWNRSIRDPAMLMLVGGLFILMVIAFAMRPRWYLPVLVGTLPLPKLFTIGYRNEILLSGDYTDSSDPGFSVSDLVLAAGIFAMVFHRRAPATGPTSQVSRALMWWVVTITLSIIIALWAWQGSYRIANVLYAARYFLTLGSYLLAAHYATRCLGYHDQVGRLLKFTITSGAWVLVGGLVYYFTIGSVRGDEMRAGVNAVNANQSLVFRSYLWFFDYGNDMGFYAVFIGTLALVIHTRPCGSGLRFACRAVMLMAIISIILLNQRANLLVMTLAIAYLGWHFLSREASNPSTLLKWAALMALGGAVTWGVLYVVQPQIISKVLASRGTDLGVDAAEYLKERGVPTAISEGVGRLPIGDNVMRLSFTVASIWAFLEHPIGAGFWGELQVLGVYAHHEVVKVLVEQGVFGLISYGFLLLTVKKVLWNSSGVRGAAADLNLVMRANSFALFGALIMANTVVLDFKYAVLYWSMLGVFTAIPAGWGNQPMPPVAGMTRVSRQA
jgi:hypothetical protein